MTIGAGERGPYERLAAALDELPNGFPGTASGVEIRILAKICSPDEAALASLLTGTPETIEAIAARADRPGEAVSRELYQLARRGIVWLDQQGTEVRFRLAPFVVGSYEAQAASMDHELAHLVEDYFASGGARGILGTEPALHRVVPAAGTVPSEVILPYDDVRSLLFDARTFHVGQCICRLQQEQLGQSCRFPVNVCLSFSEGERDREQRPGDLTKEEALALLDMTERAGLVHTVSNVANGVGYVCNCCACCCGILRGITEWGIANSVATANYVAVIDPDLCLDCGTCVERCQVGAISEGEGCSVVDSTRCIGCGLCASGCPNDVARLERKPEAELVQPPRDFSDWERRRRRNRVLPMAQVPIGSATDGCPVGSAAGTVSATPSWHAAVGGR